MTRKIKLTFVINSLVGGGAERVFTTLLSATAELTRNYDMTLILLDDETEVYKVPEWVRIIRLDCSRSFLKSILKLSAVLIREQPDITLSFLARSNVATIIAGLFARHQVVISERVNTSAHYGIGAKATALKACIRLIYRFASKVITPSSGVAEDLVQHFNVPRHKIVVINNPVDICMIRQRGQEIVQIPIEKPFNIAVGRLTKVKNFRLLIEAYAKCPDAPPLIILGQGPEEESLRAHVANLGLQHRVILAGFQDNPFAIMRHADAYVSASNGEGFPNGLVEAMALGLPVISTNCPSGPSEILAGLPQHSIDGLTHAPYGLLVPVRNVKAMAAALQLYNDFDLRARYAEAAAARVKIYSVEFALKRYWSVIQSLKPMVKGVH
ncbi:glycosyltransferase [Methylobacterium iners]|uniref:N-acetylgalactosamine-N, N'-diacetylbacillosaminyl-diphospho-undecaprenol4-alpha-N-acetylgalactosaminyltransferase n=1 Tax=Methylobacterium iners TaxID=418707 RepID=A0ABQ4S6K5_9HYPH|nr:glycosyltransferase [Methylobacterium iners]GJD98095.1 N-acetylgalactosamine-N, N'-diacetylbacillosaminyl-diphospho-undecaprenol4-alpha-N-acetylgalactosaminyltransferase [Methylobacterium iners]